jgi:hypothetical protein
VVRAGRAEAEPRAHPDRSALRRALRRPDDAHRRRRRADDGGTGRPRSKRRQNGSRIRARASSRSLR